MKRVVAICLGMATVLASSLLAGGIAINDTIPQFTLKNLDGQDVDSASLFGEVTVVTFISVQCPVSNAYNERMKELHAKYSGQDVKFVFVNSNRAEAAADVKAHAASNGFEFDVYKDPNNVVADQFAAQVTPESFVFKGGKLVYHGRIDDAQTGTINEHSLQDALNAVTAGETPARQETKAFGCTIKRVSVS